MDIFRVADQVGIRLIDATRNSGSARRPLQCYAKDTLRHIGRMHGEEHLRLVLRLIVGSPGNAGALFGENIKAVSAIILSGLVEVTADMLDDIDLNQLRAWAVIVRGKATVDEVVATALLLRLASPEKVLPRISADETAAAAKRAAIARKGRENAKRRRIKAAGDGLAVL